MKISHIILLAAAISIQSCSFTRTVAHLGPNITDHKIFPYTEVLPGDSVFRFIEGDEDELLKNRTFSSYQRGKPEWLVTTLEGYLETYNTTTAFLVIRNDSIIFEKYYKGYTRDSISTVFSISKSVTGLLAGIAIDEGYIESIHDPVTKYVPELKKKDQRFERMTVEHLLNMRTGFKFNEVYSNPFSKSGSLYYGTNQLGKIKRMKFKAEPGEKMSYQSITTALLGIVIERATGKSLGDYLQEKVWTPMGMENRATWSLDDKRHRATKSFCGLNITAIDLAKIGRLYLNKGSWNGKQIVDSAWIEKTATPVPSNYGYQNQWWSHRVWIANPETREYFPDSLSGRRYLEEKYPSFKEYARIFPVNNNSTQWSLNIYHPDVYCAQGILGQYLYVHPKNNLIVVRLGEKEGKSEDYADIIYRQVIIAIREYLKENTAK